MTVGELLRRMGSAEFEDWKAYSRIEPFGDRRADQRAWLLVAAAGNLMSDPKKGRGVDLQTILPEWRAPETVDAGTRAFAAWLESRAAGKKE